MNVNGVTSAYSSYYETQGTRTDRAGNLEDLIAQQLAEADQDGDEALSLEESGMEEELFSTMDSDGDGLVTSSEILAYIQTMFTERPSPPPPPPPSAEDMISALDADGDGGLSLEESGASQEQFDAADTNQDGIVSQAELEAAFLNGQASMPIGDMMSVAAVSQLQNTTNYQRLQEAALLNLLRGDDDESSSAANVYGQQSVRSVDLVA